MKAPLDTLKILDFTYLLPGPFGSMLLADLGAQIIKVENLRQPDLMRYAPPLVDGVSVLYAHVNRGKKSLALDLKQEEARGIVLNLVREYDIVIEQFRPGVMQRLGLGYEDLKKVNDSIIYCSLTGYGQTGTYAARAGHDINYLALSGLDSFSGRRESGPGLSGIQIADIAGGSKNTAMAVMAAVIRRMTTGKGDRIDISITDSAFSMTVMSTAPFLEGGPEPGPESEMLNGGLLYDYYRTADGRYLSVGPIEGKFFDEFCSVIGHPELAERGIGNREAKGLIAGIIGGDDLEHWIAKFDGRDACVEPVRLLSEAIVSPPIVERDMIVSVRNEKGNTLRQMGNPIKFGSGHYFGRAAGTSMGYHTRDILRGLGYSEMELDTMLQKNIIGVS
ncbi:MAG: carnitine dehydratase [Spirochaetae bacterium HGW-Spirochaetae-1]|jgi:crotonobetainyl-CoA:carnitine CoA-transferase CaiB-like acyl-CoA transferase|nr:MAG: carnitine dehydratase [Spirochaetae bacterium HGW-Spirochaetae-1]